jgi:hypothetical protein
MALQHSKRGGVDLGIARALAWARGKARLCATVTFIGMAACSADDPENHVGSNAQAMSVLNPDTQSGDNVAFTVAVDGTIIGHKPNPNDYFVSEGPAPTLLLLIGSTGGVSKSEPQPYDSTMKKVVFDNNLVSLGIDNYAVEVWAYPDVATSDWKGDPNWYDCDKASTCHTKSGTRFFQVVDSNYSASGTSNCGSGNASNDHMLLCEPNKDHAAGPYRFPFSCPAGTFSRVDLHTTKCKVTPCTELRVIGSTGTIYGITGDTNNGPNDSIVVSSIEWPGQCFAEVTALVDAKFDVKAKRINQVTAKDREAAIDVYYPTLEWQLVDFGVVHFDFGYVYGDVKFTGDIRAQKVGTVNPFVLNQGGYAVEAGGKLQDFANALTISNDGNEFKLTSSYLGAPVAFGNQVVIDPSKGMFGVSANSQPFVKQVGDWKISGQTYATLTYQFRNQTPA